MRNLIKYGGVILCFLLIGEVQAQVSINHSFKNYFLEDINTSVFPVNPFELIKIQDSIRTDFYIDNKFTKTWLGRKLLNENLLDIQEEDYRFIINPLVGLQLGNDNNRDKLLWTNTRAVQAFGKLGEKFIFYTDIYENQAQLPAYLNQYISEYKVMPGIGIPKVFGKDREAKDYAFANGYISLQANKYINLQFGHGKHFWGHGYRSMFLSDNSSNYPYLRMTTDFWKIKYVNLFTKMTDINRRIPETQVFTPKYMTAHYLSISLNDKIEIGLCEAVVYQDTLGTRGYDLNYFNPFILYRPVEYAIGSRGGNALLGGHFAYFPTPKITLYGQLLLDELIVKQLFNGSGLWVNKYSIQAGVKSFDSFIPNLYLQTELNYVRPYTYTHSGDSQNYGHYNQALAHSLGANFIESVSHIHYRYKRWFAETELMYAVQGRDFEVTNWGSDIYKGYLTREQDFGNETLQGNRTTTLFSDTKIGYIVNPSTNLRLELGYIFRKITPETPTSTLEANTTHYFHIGLVSRINNHYYDF